MDSELASRFGCLNTYGLDIVLNFLFIHSFLEGMGGREEERETTMWERNIDRIPHTCPSWGPNLQPRLVSQLGNALQATPNQLSHTGQSKN